MTVRKPVVMIVDDNPADSGLIEEAFEFLNFDAVVVAVENVPRAFAVLQRKPPFASLPLPDLIVLDLNMPVFGGHDFLREIKRDPVWSLIPIVVFSSSRRESDVSLALQLGAKRCLAKPPEWDGYVEVARTLTHELAGRPQ